MFQVVLIQKWSDSHNQNQQHFIGQVEENISSLKVIGFLVGQVMKESKGKANPGMVNKLLKEKMV